MGEERTIFDSAQAAEYLGLTIDGLQYWVYRVEPKRQLRPSGYVGRSPYWTKADLDVFQARERRGR